MNNPGRYKYMSESKDSVSVCLIDHILPRSLVLQKLIPETLHRPHPLRGQHRLPGTQLLVLQPSPSQFSQLLQPQFLVWRVPRHVAAGTQAEGDGAPPNQGLVTYARFLSAPGHRRHYHMSCNHHYKQDTEVSSPLSKFSCYPCFVVSPSPSPGNQEFSPCS